MVSISAIVDPCHCGHTHQLCHVHRLQHTHHGTTLLVASYAHDSITTPMSTCWYLRCNGSQWHPHLIGWTLNTTAWTTTTHAIRSYPMHRIAQPPDSPPDSAAREAVVKHPRHHVHQERTTRPLASHGGCTSSGFTDAGTTAQGATKPGWLS